MALAVLAAVGLVARLAGAATGPAGQIVGITDLKLDQPLRPGSTSHLRVGALILPGWHINSDHPSSEYYIPTRIKVTPPEGVSVGAIGYPPARDISLDFAPGEKLSVFTGKIAFDVPLVAAAGFKPAAAGPATVRIDYQACNDRQCLRPTSVTTTVSLNRLDAGGLDGRSVAFGAHVEEPAPGALARTFASRGWLFGFLAVLIGGLALNLTPCVYPLIGVTVAYFGNQGGGTVRVASLAVAYVLGIALMFSGVGVAAAMSGGLFGAALQNPLVLIGLAAVLLVLAASSFGGFSLQPPQWMMRRAGVARPGYLGALVMGLGMGVIAAPCIGPFVLGLLVMVERAQNAALGFALFFTLAIGLGLPYIGLALAAGSIRKLPRSGEWLQWVEQAFGFVLVGLAIYFLDPVIPDHLMTRVLPYYAAAVGIFLGFVSPVGRKLRTFMMIRWVLGAVSAAAMVYLLIPRAVPAHLEFEPFDPAMLQVALSERKPVLIDFRADWCIPCREMEQTTFVDPTVVREGARFIRLRADLTKQDESNEALIGRFNIQGVPTTLLIDSRGAIKGRKVGYIGPEQFARDLRQID